MRDPEVTQDSSHNETSDYLVNKGRIISLYFYSKFSFFLSSLSDLCGPELGPTQQPSPLVYDNSWTSFFLIKLGKWSNWNQFIWELVLVGVGNLVGISSFVL